MALQAMLRQEVRALHTLILARTARSLCSHCLHRSFRAAASLGLIKPNRRRTSLVPASPLMQSKRSLFTFQPDKTDPADPLLETFRKELNDRQEKQMSVVELTIWRRERRKRLSRLYKRIQEEPSVFAELTNDDFNMLVKSFLPTEQNRRVAGVLLRAAEYLQDLRERQSLCKAEFTIREAEQLLSLYKDLNQPVKCQSLMMDIVRMSKVPSVEAYETVIALAARDKRMNMAMNWLEDMKMDGFWPPSVMLIGSLVDGWLMLGEQEQATDFIRQHTSSFTEHEVFNTEGLDCKTLLSYVLDEIIHENLLNLRLEDALRLYQHKRELGTSLPTKIARLFTRKCLYSYQYNLAKEFLWLAANSQDRAAALDIGRQMIPYYISRSHLRLALDTIYMLEEGGVQLSVREYTTVMAKVVRAKFYMDTMRLYRRFKLLYPSTMAPWGYATIMLGMVRCKQYEFMLEVFNDMKAHVPPHQMPNAVYRALYALCAQTGNVTFFKEVIDMQGMSNSRVSHKTLTSLTACYLEAGDVESAKEVFRTIASDPDSGPDVIDFNLLLRTTAMESPTVNLNKILDVLKHMVLMNVHPVPSTFRTLIAYYRESPVEEKLFENALKYPDARRRDHIWINNIRLTRLLTEYYTSEVVRMFMEGDRGALFESAAGEPIAADAMTYKILFDALTKQSDSVRLTQELLDHMRSRKLRPDRSVYMNLIKGWSYLGSFDDVDRVKRYMQEDLGILALSEPDGEDTEPDMEADEEDDIYDDDLDDEEIDQHGTDVDYLSIPSNDEELKE